MSFDYDEIAADALEILEEFGADVTLTNNAAATYYPATGGSTASASAADTRKGAIFDFGAGDVNGPGGLIQGGDKRCLLEAGTFAPQLEDHVTANSVEYVIKGVGSINPAGTPVLYDLHLRK